MNVERYLKEYPLTGSELIRLNHELNDMIACKEECYCTLGSQILDDMPKAAHWEACSSVERAALALIETKNWYDQLIQDYVNRINALIDQKRLFENAWSEHGLLTSLEKRIIQLRCFDEMSWNNVCRTIHYSRRQCNYIYDAAVKKLQSAIIMDQVMDECLLSS